MTTAYEIPLSPTPQTLTIALSGKTYRLKLRWNVTAQVWILDITDEQGVDILTGLAVVTGCDLLEPFDYLDFGGSLVALTDNNYDLPPTFKNLGSTGHIYWITEE